MKKTIKIMIALMLLCSIALSFAGCEKTKPDVSSVIDDIAKGITPNKVSGKAADDAFINQTMRLSLDLFRMTAENASHDENADNFLISPTSIQLALAMTANGANGKTREEMETLLGGDIKAEELNEYLYAYSNALLLSGSGYKLSMANSIWFRDDENRLTVEDSFLQTNADYYRSQAYKRPFDDTTKDEINAWISENTDGMIDEIIDEIDGDVVMYLINALAFDAEWEKPYDKYAVREGVFTSNIGTTRTAEMMWSEESKYISDARATGFIKDYKGGKYSFAALLPNEGVDIFDYIESLNPNELLTTLKNAETTLVNTAMPKFSYDYDITMNDVLSELGMPTAFIEDAADFSRMAHSTHGNIFIGRVLHKTFISVDELGTKAGAVTAVEVVDEAAPMYMKTVILDRPFVYMIIDNETLLPVFIGAVIN